MRMVPWTAPHFRNMRMPDEMNRLFENFFPRFTETTEWWPTVDMVETPEELLVRFELPGVDPKEIDMSIVGDELVIKGEKTFFEKKEDNWKWFFKENYTGPFYRAIRLPVAIDADKIMAMDHNGILMITLPKKEEAKARRVPIRTHS